MPYSKIAEKISRNKSVISREICRNSNQRSGKYSTELAHRKAHEGHKNKTKHITFTEDIRGHVITLLEQEFSPEQISKCSVELDKLIFNLHSSSKYATFDK